MDRSETITLRGPWLLLDGNRFDDPSYHIAGIPEEHAIPVELPHMTHLTIEEHVGVSWYQHTFTLDALPAPEQFALLAFEQADFRAEVSVNGQPAGTHVGPEAPFAYDVTESLRLGENRITVRVSKPHNDPVDDYTFAEIPHRNQRPTLLTPGACYNESGIPGQVCLRILPRVWLEDLYLTADPHSGEICANMTLQNNTALPKEVRLLLETRHAPEGDVEDICSCIITLAPGITETTQTLRVKEPRLWDVDDPNLYSVHVTLISDCGQQTVLKKTGFREFRVGEDGYFYLNGKRLFLKCSHTGNCMPESTHAIARDPALLRRDFLMAKATGFNTIRFISGAALPMQLDLCDEIGLMVYEEPLSSWLEQNGPHAASLYCQDLFSMIRRDRSHPSLTIWGLLNETFAKPPYDEVCVAARDVLPELRKLDPTRLVLFSSGRWDQFVETGSVCNPGSDHWETLWGWEGETLSPEGDLGDIHYYPDTVPFRESTKQRLRSFGKGTDRPVFVSEIGVGSALDTVSLLRRMEQEDAIPFAPDVKMIRGMNQCFLREIEKFGFADAIPFPSELMAASMKNHVYYRTQLFDYLRGNPNLCGVSLTGLLDHSICGEGLWTLYREFKPMIADVLQDGFSKVRWCVHLSAPNLWPGQPLTVEASVATEDVLKVGQTYQVRAGILDQNGAAYDVREFSFTVTEKQARDMVVPVFHESWDTTLLPPGVYRFKTEVLSGANVSGGIREFHITPKAHSAKGKKVCCVGMSEADLRLLESLGYTAQPLEAYQPGDLVAAGNVAEAELETLRSLLTSGARVVTLRAWKEEDLSLQLLPEDRRPVPNRQMEWLYHRETVLRPGGRYFSNMRTGLADALLYTDLLTAIGLEAEGAQIPDQVDAFVFKPGYHGAESGFMGGYTLGSYQIGEGTLLVNCLDLLDSADHAPYAAQLLVNVLDNT